MTIPAEAPLEAGGIQTPFPWIPDQVRDGEKEEPPRIFRRFIVFIGQYLPLPALTRIDEIRNKSGNAKRFNFDRGKIAVLYYDKCTEFTI
jgi:hypothetical protein